MGLLVEARLAVTHLHINKMDFLVMVAQRVVVQVVDILGQIL
jgi:hypothetical protein